MDSKIAILRKDVLMKEKPLAYFLKEKLGRRLAAPGVIPVALTRAGNSAAVEYFCVAAKKKISTEELVKLFAEHYEAIVEARHGVTFFGVNRRSTQQGPLIIRVTNYEDSPPSLPLLPIDGLVTGSIVICVIDHGKQKNP